MDGSGWDEGEEGDRGGDYGGGLEGRGREGGVEGEGEKAGRRREGGEGQG